jgi:hypothetical protein
MTKREEEMKREESDGDASDTAHEAALLETTDTVTSGRRHRSHDLFRLYALVL